jgi:DNA-binding NtrC family response regulator
LRVLQEKEVTPIGATEPVPVDMRVVAATHQDLERLVEQKRFRRDLFMRISGFRVDLPPLRDRREDIGHLIASILRDTFGDGAEKIRFEADATRALWRNRWQGNIRELERCLQVAVVNAGGKPISADHLPIGRHRQTEARRERREAEESERQARLVGLLREHHGNISAVARAFGRDRRLIRIWLQRYGIDPAEYRR